MATVHEFPCADAAHRRLLIGLVEAAIADHPDPDVVERWASMARDTLSRYPAPPTPAASILDLSGLRELDSAHRQEVVERITNWIENWQIDVRDQLTEIHRDFLLLQCRVAELEVELERRRSPMTPI